MKALLVGHEQGDMDLLTRLNSLVSKTYHDRFESIDSRSVKGHSQFCYPDPFFERTQEKDYDVIIGLSADVWDTHEGPAWDEYGYRFCVMDNTQDYNDLASHLKPKIGPSTIEEKDSEKNSWLVIRCPYKEETGRNIINHLLDYILQNGGK